MCGLDGQLQWKPLYRAPLHSSELVSTIPRRPTLIRYERNTHYWFEDKDGVLLLCRQDPQGVNLGRCNSDGWLFKQYNGAWQVTNAWESACTE
jgi:hypothetical protein